MSADRPLLGILLMLGFCMLVPMADAIGKYLIATIPLLVLIAVRFFSQALLLLPMYLIDRRRIFTDRRLLWLTAIRTGLHVVGLAAMFTALRYLPLADAIAIAFVMPFIMLLLGHYVLGEEVGRNRFAACVVGFIGTLLVVQPSFASVGAPALLPLLVAVVFALFMLVTRSMAKGVDPIALQAISGVMACLVIVPAILIGQRLQLLPDVPMPTRFEVYLLVIFGVIGMLAHLLMTWSLRFAPSATLAPMQYLEIPFATLVGWLVFRDFPNDLALAGIIISVGAGLYIVFRERALSKTAA